MKNYGKTLKKIRESLMITQIEISAGIMSQSNYSKAEKGEIDIPFSKMSELLNRLGMSVDEFLYIHNDYEKSPGGQLNRLSSLKTGNKQKVMENLDELKAVSTPTKQQKELLLIFEAFLLVLDNEYDAASEKVVPIWNRLKKYNTWYLYDIRLINSILYLFPIDVAESIMNLALTRLEAYKDFRSISQLSANFQINFILLLIDHGHYKAALDKTDKLISFSQEKRLYMHLATCYVRKGILLKNLRIEDPSAWYNKGFEILDTTNNDGLVKELRKEIEHYATN